MNSARVSGGGGGHLGLSVQFSECTAEETKVTEIKINQKYVWILFPVKTKMRVDRSKKNIPE